MRPVHHVLFDLQHVGEHHQHNVCKDLTTLQNAAAQDRLRMCSNTSICSQAEVAYQTAPPNEVEPNHNSNNNLQVFQLIARYLLGVS